MVPKGELVTPEEMKLLKLCAKEHDTKYTDFNIIMPSSISKEAIFSMAEKNYFPALWPPVCWMKFSIQDIEKNKFLKRPVLQLVKNYALEENFIKDADPFENIEEVWVLGIDELKPHLKTTDKINLVGFLLSHHTEIAKTIELCWIHPFLRGQKIMQRLVCHLSEEDYYQLAGTVTREMEIAFRKGISASKKAQENFIASQETFAEKKFGIKMPDDKVRKSMVMGALTMLPQSTPNGEVQKMVDILKEIPQEVLEELKHIGENVNIDPEELIEEMRQHKNHQIALDELEKSEV
jgi:hypothetical protein